MSSGTAAENTSRIDVLSLEDFRTTLDARQGEAESVRTSLVQILQHSTPKLGDLPDATYVCGRYQTLFDQHLASVDLLLRAILATREALTTIMDNYQTTEERLTADANEIADALGGASGAGNGECAHA